jgi:hypothetical protein
MSLLSSCLLLFVGDPLLASFAQTYPEATLAKMAPAALLQAAHAAGVIGSAAPKTSEAAALLAWRERAAAGGGRAAEASNYLLTPGFAGLPDSGMIPVSTWVSREPNDTRAWADDITCGTTTGSISSANDADFVAVDIAAPTLFRAETGAGSGTAVGDTLLELTDERGGFIVFDDDSGPALYSRVQVPLLPGRYHLRLSGFNGATGSWNLTTTCTPLDLEQFVPGQATPGSVSAADPLRAYRMVLAQDTDLTLRCNGAAGFDPILLLRNASGAAVLNNDDASSIDLSSELRAHLPAGSYQLWVQGFSGSTGSFTLLTTAQSVAEVPSGCPSPLGSIASPTEFDFYRLELADGAQRGMFFATRPQIGGASDTTAALYDAELRRVDLVDDTPEGLYAILDLPLVPGTYYAVIGAFSGSAAFGSYATEVDCTSEADVSKLECNSELAVGISEPNRGVLVEIGSLTDQPVELRATNAAYADALDSVAILLDGDGLMRDYNDDADSNGGSAVGARFGPGTVHVLVTGFGDSSTGRADVRVDCSLRVNGTPVIGGAIEHASRGKAGDFLICFGANAGASPFAIPGLNGVLLLDPSQVETVANYQMGSTGQRSIPFRVPPSKSLIGVQYFVQNVDIDLPVQAGRFSNRVDVTFLDKP